MKLQAQIAAAEAAVRHGRRFVQVGFRLEGQDHDLLYQAMTHDLPSYAKVSVSGFAKEAVMEKVHRMLAAQRKEAMTIRRECLKCNYRWERSDDPRGAEPGICPNPSCEGNPLGRIEVKS